MAQYTTCSCCNHRFDIAERGETCSRCAMLGTGGCHKVRCPQCGYEMPAPARLPGLLKKVAGLLAGKKNA